MFNRNNIEIFIKTKVADFHLTQNTILHSRLYRKTGKRKRKKERQREREWEKNWPKFFASLLLGFSSIFLLWPNSFSGFCVETRWIELYITIVVAATADGGSAIAAVVVVVVASPCQTFHRLISLLSNSFSLDIIDISCNE